MRVLYMIPGYGGYCVENVKTAREEDGKIIFVTKTGMYETESFEGCQAYRLLDELLRTGYINLSKVAVKYYIM